MAIAKETENTVKVTMTVKECADFIDTSITTMYTMCRENQIPHLRIRGKILFHKDTIDEWLRNGGTNE